SEGPMAHYGSLCDAAQRGTLTLNMLPHICSAFILIFLCCLLPAEGQRGTSGTSVRTPGVGTSRGEEENIQVTFTPTVCRIHCINDRCSNHCQKSNMTTVYSRGGGGGGFRVCESCTHTHTHRGTNIYCTHTHCTPQHDVLAVS
uniref:Uncharacterized protein n=1 Tax=Gouania willdenowi TaxID=441366 RepID=A0A8C5DW57_GOUWI